MRPAPLWAALALMAATTAVAVADAAAGRRLVIVLDAVPYDTMARLTTGDPPLFADLAPPVPLISTFPSTTSIALAGILGDHGLEPSPGYEARFFDWQAGRRRGGGPLSYFRVEFPWREYFDWNRRGPLRNALHAARPVRAGIGELRRALAAFEASSEPTFTIYIADTDTAAHLFGPTGLDPMLAALDADLRRLRERLGSALQVIVFSDHGLAGGPRLRNVLPAVRRALEAAGFGVGDRLAGPRSVVLTPYGLVSSLEAYVAAEEAPAAAAALAAVPGVDFCARRAGDGWSVEARHWAVRVTRRELPSPAWRWELRGDPADGLAAALAAVAASGTWVDDERLLASTADGPYPDPLYRIAGAFAAVDNPASIVCSLAAGHMYGARGTERSARWTKGALRWTHGALERSASLGFLMADEGSEPPPRALRYDRALDSHIPSPPPRMASQ